MNILFVHQNFPGQFKHLAPAMAKRGHQVVALTMKPDMPQVWQGVRMVAFTAVRGNTPGIHPWVVDFESKTIRAEAALKAAFLLKEQGFIPDAIVVHPGWGEGLFLKQVWPQARLGMYCEFFYHAQGADTDFDPEFSEPDPSAGARLLLKNANNLMHIESADAGLSPTQWQASTFPERFRSKITVIHDGIDTQAILPDINASLTLKTSIGLITLKKSDEVVTFVNRNLEPYRGYHIFMRALPQILAARPQAQILIVGGDGVSYGSRAPHGKTWKEIFIAEVKSQIADADWARVHFLGTLPYASFTRMLQLSSVHVYLTYPFVLSWSLLEAMSAGCAIVASDTLPLREVIQHGESGQLFNFFDANALASEVVDLLADVSKRQSLGRNARQYVTHHYDLKRVCLPAQIKWVEQLIN